MLRNKDEKWSFSSRLAEAEAAARCHSAPWWQAPGESDLREQKLDATPRGARNGAFFLSLRPVRLTA